MYIESEIINFSNKILSKVQEKTNFLTEKSYILSKIEHLMFYLICITIVGLIFLNNNITAILLCGVSLLYFLTLIFKKDFKFSLNKSSLFLLLYFLLTIVSTINSTMPKESIIGLSKTILYLLFFIAIYGYLKIHKEKIYFLSGIIAICVSIEIIFAFLQNSLNVMSAATWQDTSRLNPELVLTRVYGTLKPSNPNLLGGYLIATIPFLWMQTAINYIEKRHKRFLISFVFSIASISAIFMTGCRGAYLALFAMLALFVLVIYNIWKSHYPKIYNWVNIHKKMIVSTAVIAISGILICVPKISHRILSIFAMRNDSSTSFRMNVYNSSIEMFQDNILMGIGCGNKVFREIYGLYMLSGFDALSAYCIFLEIAVESGIFSLIFFLLFLYYLIYYGYQSYKKSGKIKEKIILASGIISIIGILTHGLFDTIFFRPQVQTIFWIATAAIYVYSEEKYVKNK